MGDEFHSQFPVAMHFTIEMFYSLDLSSRLSDLRRICHRFIPRKKTKRVFALREWRRQNASRIEEKEKAEKELLNQIIDEADAYKISFHGKRKTIRDNNIASNRESEKIYLSALDKFHVEADKNYWKAIADLIPKEVPVIETRGGKKEQDKKPSVVVLQGPKPGKPTDLSRMRQILIKLKHNSPLHLEHAPSQPAAPPPVAVA
ncbi:hypothetical protein L1987_25104 [Smallanthus sonchifolius]|uniref:Uncharacterized protein n=1 Tax=Smallanthus sonchifolius TaxID=185202 RepID=A0ACB9IMG8_9ASTR|nr:hypothetical protein L1987_25104 [Smallanthus sonchifolius]